MGPMSRRSRAVITFVASGALMAAVGALVLTRAPPRIVLVGAPGIKAIGPSETVGIVDVTTGDLTVCQADEVLPRGVSAIRLSILGFYGSRVTLAAYRGSQLLTGGTRDADWTSDSVTVPVTPLGHPTSGVRLCFTLGPNSEPIIMLGSGVSEQQAAVIAKNSAAAANPTASPSKTLYGRVGVEYLASGRGSWWSRVLSVARHVGLGRAYSGTWITLLLVALMAIVGGLAVRLTLRELP
jgi:hypothetical protein